MSARADRRVDRPALAAWLRGLGLDVPGDIALQPLTGGQSNPTWRLTGARPDLVLRARPTGPLLPSAHAIDREYRVMRALAQTDVPVPRMFGYCDDDAILETPFFVMEFLAGRVFTDQSLPGVAAGERGAIYAEMVRVIAALHRIDPDAVGLGDFGRPGNYFARQIARWTRQYRDSRTLDIPAMDALIDWLPQHIPATERTGLVHGDFRLDNLVFHPSEPRIIGVLDWELATLGDPLADFAYHCMSRHIPHDLWRGIAGLDLAALGIPSEAETLARYCSLTGFPPPADWDFYLAYNLFRMAAILQGIARRVEEGTATAPDARETGAKAGPLADLGWRLARQSSAIRAG